MKKKPSLAILILFSLNLCLGMYTGQALVSLIQTSASRSEAQVNHDTPTSVPIVKNGQGAIVFITAKNPESAAPQMKSAWMMSYVVTNPALTLMPIYPSPSPYLHQRENVIADTFRLTPGKGFFASPELDPAFRQILTDRKFLVMNYVVLDEVARDAIVSELLGFLANDSYAPASIAQVLTAIPDPREDPSGALWAQAEVYQQICNGLSAGYSDNLLNNLDRLFHRYKDHIYTDLDHDLLLADLQALQDLNPDIRCEFPTLAIQTTLFSPGR